jgi:aspartate-semialdehyde dehydrogenase
MSRVAVVHPTSLVAKELRERLEARADLGRDLRLYSLDEEEIGAVTEAAGAATFVARLEDDSLAGVDLAFFCGDIERTRAALARLPRSVPAVILSPGATGDDAPYAVAGVRGDALVGLDRVTSPHPAAVALALLLAPLAGLRPRRVSATAVLPVSALGDAGIDELFEQTRGILAFSGTPRPKRFAAQIAFNLLPSPEDAAGIARAALDAVGLDLPLSLQLVQGGVFHSLAVTLEVDLETPAEPAEVRRTLGRWPTIELAREPRKLGPVAAAGEEKLLVGEVRAGSRPGAHRIWAVMDNLVRGGALNAVELGAALVAAGPPS